MKDLDRFRPYLPLLIAVLIAAFGGSAASIVLLVDDDNDPATPPKQVKIDLPKLPTVIADRDNQREAAEQVEGVQESDDAGAAEKNQPDLHEDMRDETPAGVNPLTVAKGIEKTEKLTEIEERRGILREPREPAGAQSYSCPSAHVRNQSALSSPRKGVSLHFTVSQPGSLLAIRGLFNTPSFGASSNYGFELFNLRCQQWVPDHRKAWCQGAANSAYNCIEIISNDRSRAGWLGTPAIRTGQLAALVADLLKKSGAPVRLVDPVGCVWPAGLTDHDRLECGNTHWDVGKHFPWDVFLPQVRRAHSGVSSAATSPLTQEERKIIRGATSPKGTGHSRRYWCQRNDARRGQLTRLAKTDGGYRKRNRGVRRHLLGKNAEKHCR